MTPIGSDAPSKIRVFHASTMTEAARKVVGSFARSIQEPVLVLPSALDRGDPLMQAVRQELRSQTKVSSALLPEHPVRVATDGWPARSTRWQAISLAPPDKSERTLLLPARLMATGSVLYVTYINTVARTGPFQLDLLSRYIHPRDRLRLVANPDRAGLAAELNLVVQPTWCVIGSDIPTGIVAVTSDLIAGELFALCLAEKFFDRRSEFSSPWEDRVVQRATELELGALTPGDIRIEVVGGKQVSPLDDVVKEIVTALGERIGIDANAG